MPWASSEAWSAAASLLVLALHFTPVFAQDPGKSAGGSTYSSKRYPVKITAPAGWTKAG